MKKTGTFAIQLSREAIDARIGEMEKKIERLRSSYESFFMGVERIPPDTLRRDMNRLMLEMQQVTISNSSLRFRFQSLSQKWVLHITYWNRTMRDIEAGTFRRDMARTQRHLAARGGVITEEEALALGIPKNRVRAFVARHQHPSGERDKQGNLAQPSPETAGPPPVNPAPVPARSGPPPIPASARKPPVLSLVPESGSFLPGLGEGDFDLAYSHYLQAHQKLGVEAQALPKEKMRERLGRQLPKILEDRKCARLQLEVAVEDGKVRLRAWPARDPH